MVSCSYFLQHILFIFTPSILFFTWTRILLIGRQEEHEKLRRVLNAPVSYHIVSLKVIDDHIHTHAVIIDNRLT